jgi:membrane peptidoglycan carboxypeptidase
VSGKRRAAGPAVTKKAPSKATSATARTRKQKIWRVAKWLLVVGLVGALLGVAAFVVVYQKTDIPTPNENFETQTSFVYYSDGKSQLGSFATQNRESIPLDEMPQTMQDAVVAAENKTFWTDKGIDPRGILRAAFSNAQGNDTQGASTITQQYVKVYYLTQEQTLTRKLKEAVLSLKLQREVSKKEILEGYLNTIYFGRGAYGVQAAAKAYFDIEAKDLDLRQSAYLTTVLNNPSRYSPDGGKDARADIQERYDYVLTAMAEEGYISADERDRAMKRLPRFPEIEKESQYGGQRGHVLTMVRKELLRLGFTDDEIDGGGLRVTTTLTDKAMTAVEEGVLAGKPEDFGDKFLHIGAASVEPGTGALRGLYGGQDYLDSQINWAVAGGQAGSTFKPFAVAAAIKDGFSLKDTFEGNSPYVLPDGTDVENQGDQDYGSAISMLNATVDSVNTAFIDMTLSMDDGPEKIIETAYDMGIPKEQPTKGRQGFPNSTPGLLPQTGVALGSQTVSPINMANAYATLANEGVAAEPYLIEEVKDANGESLYNHKVINREAIDPDIAADVSYALQQVVQDGSGTAALELGRPAAGKTGTATNGQGEVSSAWFTGYTPQMATSVMYVRGKGNEQLQGWLPSYFGGAYPAETWTAIMTRLMQGLPVEEFPEPVYVDGEAPTDGHEPYTPPPTTKQPSPTQETTSESPSEETTKTNGPPSSPGPPTSSETCELLDCDTTSPTESESPGNGNPSGGDNSPNNKAAYRERD